MTKMIPERKALLIEALESGKYGKAVGSLRRSGNKFCCLGVASDISGVGEWEGADFEYGSYRSGNETSVTGLTHAVAEWLFGEDFGDAGGFGAFGERTSFVNESGDVKEAIDIAAVNDCSVTFAPVIAMIKEMF